jgi:hypothetical protein
MGQKGRFNMGQDEKTKPETGIEALGKAAEQLRKVVDGVVSKLEYVEDTGIEKVSDIADQVRELARELVEQRLGKTEPAKEGQALPVANEQLLQVAAEFSKDVKRQHGLMLAAIEILLAGADMLSCDCIAVLQEERGILKGGMQSQNLNGDEDEENTEAENGEAKDCREYSLEDCESTIEGIEQALCPWVPLKQAAVLKHMLSLMPERQREHEGETAANEACEEFINYIAHNKSDDEQKAFYEEALAAVKAGNGIVELKQTA